jgi:HlyD family secretion protein
MKYFITCVILCSLISCSGRDGDEISASGTIEAVEVSVSAKVGGQIIKMQMDEGSQVKAGDTLALVDRSDLEIQFDQAKANADAAEAQLRFTVLGAREEDVAQAEATLKNAQDDLARIEKLFGEGSVSQKQLDDARMRQTVSKQMYEKLKRGPRSEEIDAARARRDQANAQLKSIQKKINDSYVTAPVSGVITQKSIEEGEVVMPNGVIFRISRLDNVNLMIYISEEELARVKLKQNADVYIDAEPKKPFTGIVTYISSIAEFTPKNVQTKEDRTKLVFGVKIEIPNAGGILKPGMPADAVIKY